MEFIALVEGYGGAREYNSIERFSKTLRAFIMDAKEGESIKFTLSGIRAGKEVREVEEIKEEVEEGGYMTLEKKYDVAKAEIIKELRTFVDGATTSALNEGLQISLRTLHEYLKKMRDEGSIRFEKVKNKFVYHALSEVKSVSPKGITIEQLKLFHEKGLLNEKGKDMLIDMLRED